MLPVGSQLALSVNIKRLNVVLKLTGSANFIVSILYTPIQLTVFRINKFEVEETTKVSLIRIP